MTDVLGEHTFSPTTEPYGWCSCGRSGKRDEHDAHVAAILEAGPVAEAERRALTEAADAWQWGQWTVLTAPIKAETQPQRIIGAAQAVTDWLRTRAAAERGAS